MKIEKIVALLLCTALVMGTASCGKIPSGIGASGPGSSSGAGKDPGADGSSSSEKDPGAGSSSQSGSASGSESIVEIPKEEVYPMTVGYVKGLGVNPYTCTDEQNLSLSGLLYEPLFELDSGFEALPCLAKSIKVTVDTKVDEVPVEDEEDEKKKKSDSDTGEAEAEAEESGEDTDESGKKKKKTSKPKKIETVTVYTSTTSVTVKLREKVKFSDGSALTADDVVYSLEQASAKGSNYAGRLSGISKITASGKYTVTFQLEGAVGNAAALLDIPIVAEGTADKDSAEKGRFPVGTGPYVLVRDKKGIPVSFTAHKKWWRLGQTEEREEDMEEPETDPGAESAEEEEKVHTVSLPVKNIQVLVEEAHEGLVYGFASRQITLVPTDLTGINSTQFTGNFAYTDFQTTNFIYLGCNTADEKQVEKLAKAEEKKKKANPKYKIVQHYSSILKNEKLRTALYRSLDRDKLTRRMMAGHAKAALMPISPNSLYYNKKLAQSLVYDKEKAKELYQENEVKDALRLIVNNDSEFKKGLAREIAEQLREAGWKVKVEIVSWKKYTAALKTGDYDLYLGEVKLKPTFDLSPLLIGSMNYSGYTNDKLTAALYAFNGANDSKRSKAAKKLYTLLSEQAPFIPVCFKTNSVLYQDGSILRQYNTQQNLFYHLWNWEISDEVLKKSQIAVSGNKKNV